MADSTRKVEDGCSKDYKEPKPEESGVTSNSEYGRQDGSRRPRQGQGNSYFRRQRAPHSQFRFPTRTQNTDEGDCGNNNSRSIGGNSADSETQTSLDLSSKSTKLNWQQKQQWYGKGSASSSPGGGGMRYKDNAKGSSVRPKSANQKAGKGYPNRHQQRQQYGYRNHSAYNDHSTAAAPDTGSLPKSVTPLFKETVSAQPPDESGQLPVTATDNKVSSGGHGKQSMQPSKTKNQKNQRRSDRRSYPDHQFNEQGSPHYNKDRRYERRSETTTAGNSRNHRKKPAFSSPATFSRENLEYSPAADGVHDPENSGKTTQVDYENSGAKPKQSSSAYSDSKNSKHSYYHGKPVESWDSKNGKEKAGEHSHVTLGEVISHQSQHLSGKGQQHQQKQKIFKAPKGKPQKTTENQLSTLIEHLSNGSYECMVCCEVVKQQHAIWSCLECYAVFHIHCIKKWARSPVAAVSENENGWRCPACQNVAFKVPYTYKCFCGRLREPQWKPGETPHSCGELCQRPRKDTQCTHSCNILCHPGPCPPCPVNVTKSCDCGKSKLTMRCGQSSVIHCELVCQKALNCGLHFCQSPCHGGPCLKCDTKIKQDCFCGKASRHVICGTSEAFECKDGYYSCQEACSKVLLCGNHSCERTCHPGDCGGCPYRPDQVTHCPCGQTPLERLGKPGQRRTSCTDPIPTCKLVCSKPLGCGNSESPHVCQLPCHTGPCPPCTGTSTVTCRCKLNDLELACAELIGRKKVPLCTQKCNKKKTCGKHKCNQTCCVEEEHKCTSLCRKKLNCGLHRCEDRCHPGNCSRCLQSSFDELTCHCGASVIYPPVACGTQPPTCSLLCARPRPCQHPIMHSCHPEEACPPCTVLTQCLCLGGHELRSNIPCHIKEISCGRPCGKPLPCGNHKCQFTCHKGECLTGKQRCKQPCSTPRADCGHPCNAPCHSSSKKCPKIPCKQLIKVSCKCGNRTEKVQCLMGGSTDYMAATYQRMSTSALASQMNAVQTGQTVDISRLVKGNQTISSKRELECNEECAVKDRNRRLAEALDLVNPDLSDQPAPKEFTPFLKDYAQHNPTFVASVEKDFISLIQALQKNVKVLRKTYLFPTMKREQRHLVHELAEFYNCETEGVDPEPNRSVLVTAFRAKSVVPSQTLTSAMRRGANPPPPPPIPHHGSVDSLRSSIRAAKQSTLLKDEPAIDYFDMGHS